MDDLATIPLPGASRPLGANTVGDRHALLHSIYAYAVAPSRKLAAHNPCVGTDLPKRHKQPPKALMPAEWQALYAALRQIDPHAADLCLFLLASGWRWSEAAALSITEVEDFGDDLYVTMGHVVRRNAHNEFTIVEDAKSTAGLRRTRLDLGAAAMVRRRVEQAARTVEPAPRDEATMATHVDGSVRARRIWIGTGVGLVVAGSVAAILWAALRSEPTETEGELGGASFR